MIKTLPADFIQFFIAIAYPGTILYHQAVKEKLIKPRWWVSQYWNQKSYPAFQKRWGWMAEKGTLKTPGFDIKAGQRRAIRTFYLRPKYVFNTLKFALKNPHFIKHLFYLGWELFRSKLFRL
ncbi:hypothetical protein ACFLR5_01170 [Elusimicrobiota bacterium]